MDLTNRSMCSSFDCSLDSNRSIRLFIVSLLFFISSNASFSCLFDTFISSKLLHRNCKDDFISAMSSLTFEGGILSTFSGNQAIQCFCLDGVSQFSGCDTRSRWMLLSAKSKLFERSARRNGQRAAPARPSGCGIVSLNRLSVGCGTTPRRQSGDICRLLFGIRVIYKMLPPHGHCRNIFFYKQLQICISIYFGLI